MATVQTTSNLSNSIRTQYDEVYYSEVMVNRLYDQLAVPFPGLTMEQAIKGSSVQAPFLSGMQPGVTAISQVADVTPQVLVDATASITPTSRGEALQWAENVEIQAYTNYGEERFKKLGQNMMESVEILAIAAACQGSLSFLDNTSRANLDAGSSSDRASDALFRKYHGLLMSLKVPGFVDMNGEANTWAAIMHPFPFHDISESGNVDSIGLYQDRGIHLNFELGQLGPFRFVVSPWAKVFGGAGADAASNVNDTLGSAATRLDTTITTSSDVSTNIVTGLFVTIGTEETGNTFYPTNERVRVVSASTTTVTILGEGENGGLRFNHDSGAGVRNADSVYTIIFGGPGSLVKVYAPSVGEYGMTVGPLTQGLLEQWNSLGWKFYGNYGRLVETRVLRHECTTSYEA